MEQIKDKYLLELLSNNNLNEQKLEEFLSSILKYSDFELHELISNMFDYSGDENISNNILIILKYIKKEFRIWVIFTTMDGVVELFKDREKLKEENTIIKTWNELDENTKNDLIIKYKYKDIFENYNNEEKLAIIKHIFIETDLLKNIKE
jgi:hypothetical protein